MSRTRDMPLFPRVLALAFALCVPADASDHTDVLEARKQGRIASFSVIMRAARAAVGSGMVMLDADTVGTEPDLMVKVYFREQRTGQLVVVTLDADTVAVVDIEDPRTRRAGTVRRNPHSETGSRPAAEGMPTGRSGSAAEAAQSSRSAANDGGSGGSDAGNSGNGGGASGGGSSAGSGGGNDTGSGGHGTGKGGNGGNDGGRDGKGGDRGGKDGDRGGKNGGRGGKSGDGDRSDNDGRSDGRDGGK